MLKKSICQRFSLVSKSGSFPSARVLCCKTPPALYRIAGRVGGPKQWQFSTGESSVLQNASSSIPNSWHSRGLQTVAIFIRREFCAAKRHQLCCDFLAQSEAPRSGSFQTARALSCKTPSALCRFLGTVGGSKKWQLSIGESFVLHEKQNQTILK